MKSMYCNCGLFSYLIGLLASFTVCNFLFLFNKIMRSCVLFYFVCLLLVIHPTRIRCKSVLTIIAAFVGSTPVNASQSTAAIATAASTPDVTLNANQDADLSDAGQAATSDTNQVFTSVDVSECASSNECPLSGGAIQLNDENVRSRPPLDFDHGMS